MGTKFRIIKYCFEFVSYSSCISEERTMRNLNQHNRYHDWGSNRVPPEYKSEELQLSFVDRRIVASIWARWEKHFRLKLRCLCTQLHIAKSQMTATSNSGFYYWNMARDASYTNLFVRHINWDQNIDVSRRSISGVGWKLLIYRWGELPVQLNYI
jgi:hypothetical protein